MSYYQDATSYNTRRRSSKMAPKAGVNVHALDAAAAVDRQREPLSPEIVARFKADRLWHLREFDSLVPAGRQDALQLRTWLTSQYVQACGWVYDACSCAVRSPSSCGVHDRLMEVLPDGWNQKGAAACADAVRNELWNSDVHDVYAGCVHAALRCCGERARALHSQLTMVLRPRVAAYQVHPRAGARAVGSLHGTGTAPRVRVEFVRPSASRRLCAARNRASQYEQRCFPGAMA